MVTTNKCCDKCYSTYTTDDWTSHETLDACINQGCDCHTKPTVEPTECDHSATVGGFCKCARKALNLTEPTETGWEEEFDENVLAWKSSDPHVSSSPLVLIEPYRFAVSPKEVKDFIRETLARQKEELLKELERQFQLPEVASAVDQRSRRFIELKDALTIIKNLKGGV